MPRTNGRRLSDSERGQRRAQDRERMQAAARELLSSDGWQRWVRVRAANGLSRYSLNNQLLIAMQTRGTATFVAGFRAWLKLGYCVNGGESAIRIFAPVPIKRDRQTDDEEPERLTLFRAVPVFDRQQVSPLPNGEPTPLEPPREPLTGDSHAALLQPLKSFVATLGFSVSFEPIDGTTGGWCDPQRKRIVIDASTPSNGQVRTLVHEIAHALGVGYDQYGRERAEVIVDTVTFIVCSSVGLDVGGESIPYVAGWGEDGALEAVTDHASLIDELARRLERALAVDEDSANAEAA